MRSLQIVHLLGLFAAGACGSSHALEPFPEPACSCKVATVQAIDALQLWDRTLYYHDYFVGGGVYSLDLAKHETTLLDGFYNNSLLLVLDGACVIAYESGWDWNYMAFTLPDMVPHHLPSPACSQPVSEDGWLYYCYEKPSSDGSGYYPTLIRVPETTFLGATPDYAAIEQADEVVRVDAALVTVAVANGAAYWVPWSPENDRFVVRSIDVATRESSVVGSISTAVMPHADDILATPRGVIVQGGATGSDAAPHDVLVELQPGRDARVLAHLPHFGRRVGIDDGKAYYLSRERVGLASEQFITEVSLDDGQARDLVRVARTVATAYARKSYLFVPHPVGVDEDYSEEITFIGWDESACQWAQSFCIEPSPASP